MSIASRLSTEQANHAWKALCEIPKKSTDTYVLSIVGKGFAALAGRMPTEDRLHAAELLVSLSGQDAYLAEDSPYTTVVELLDAANSERLLTIAIENMLCQCGTVPSVPIFDSIEYDSSTHDVNSLPVCLAAFLNPRKIMELSSHPSCVGKPREYLLQRFEELVLHNSQHVFLKPEGVGDAGEAKSPGADADRLAGDSTDLRLPLARRRFHNLHDAAAWIEQNWPDFDLEYQHPVTWRAEPQ